MITIADEAIALIASLKFEAGRKNSSGASADCIDDMCRYKIKEWIRWLRSYLIDIYTNC